jgi:hypothetical protein
MSDKCTNNIRILLDKYKHHLVNENIKINILINTDEGLYECLSFINDVKSTGHKKLQKGPYLLFFLWFNYITNYIFAIIFNKIVLRQ